MSSTRRQLSLYLSEREAAPLELVRRRLDPVQAGLIPAHVTLCREDELATVMLGTAAQRLRDAPALSLCFGKAERFDGHGIRLPCIAGEPEFRALRVRLLGDVPMRRQLPHITLAHPRNPQAAGNRLSMTDCLPQSIPLRFASIRLIAQVDGGPWRVLEEFGLGA
ncbi:MAG: 2'-5' RNA ligase family protein [Arenimonas sp.]